MADPIGMAPMAETLRPTDRVGIVFSDITRATPYELLIPPLLKQLTALPDERITFFNATGTHRSNTREELITILGSEVVNRFRILQNDCTDTASHRFVGSTPSGNRISILSEFLDCEVKVLTGFIEPHFFAGMSGGGKAIMPGLALLETILCNHSASHMDHPQVRWGATEGNPLWEEVRDAALLAGESFILNVALNTLKEITAVFAGAFPDAHRAGCAYVREHAMAPVESEFDIVVTSNSGYPLDLNMYQAVKGMSAARQIVRRGGHIVVAADCWDGIPDHGDYGRLLTNASTPANLLETIRTPGFARQDQWQAQIHAAICEQTTVHFYSDHLTEEQITGAFMEPTHDISVTVTELVASGRGSRICVLPFGPLTIPYVAKDDTGLEMISDDRSCE
jgi:nickel-dependent lactate racemase